MTDKKDKYRLKVGICVDRDIHNKSLVLRDKFNINISSLCRNAILAEYDKVVGNPEASGGGL